MGSETSKKSNWLYMGIGVLLLIFASIVYMFLGAINKEDNPSAATQKIVAKNQPPYDIGITLRTFQTKWNSWEESKVKKDLGIKNFKKEDKGKLTIYAHVFDPTLTLLIMTNNRDNSVSGAMVIGRPTNDESKNSNIFYALLLLTMTANPELDEHERRALITRLVGTSEDRSQLNSSVVCGNNMYTARFERDKGFVFTVCNVLEYKMKSTPSDDIGKVRA